MPGTVFFDVDTQIDFLFPAGALWVPGAETLLPVIARLNRHASAHGIPLISTMDAHAENDEEFRRFPAHCVAGTLAQRKPEATLVPGQTILRKRHVDCFTAPELPALLGGFAARRYLVYGVVTEICVRHAALGLLRTGAAVHLIQDATMHLNPSSRDAFLDEFTASGGQLASTGFACGIL